MRTLRHNARLAWLALNLAFCGAPAGAAPICQGRDLSESPDVTPDFAKHADELVNGEGLLWRIDKPGLAPSYLFGTIHSTNAEAVALAREAATFIKGANTVATELGGVLDAQQKIDMGAAMLKAALSPAEDTIVGAFDARDVERIDAFVRERGYAPQMAHHLKLWFLAAATSFPACESEGAWAGLPEVDQLIAETAKALGVRVVGLETVDEQLSSLSSVSPQIAASMLGAAARVPSLDDDSYVTLLALYMQKRPARAIMVSLRPTSRTPKNSASAARSDGVSPGSASRIAIARAGRFCL